MFHLTSLFQVPPHLAYKYHGQYCTSNRLLTLSICPMIKLVIWTKEFLTGHFVKHLNFSFWSIWPRSIWLQLFPVTCSLFEDHLLCTIANKSWWDFIPSIQQWQGLTCFTSECNLESSIPSKACGIYLGTSVAPSRHCTIKHHVWEHRMW